MMHKNSVDQMAVSVVGSRGYAGVELVQMLNRHPYVAVKNCFASDMDQDQFENLLTTPIVFLATPAEVSFELAPKLLQSGICVIDLSGAFRLPPLLSQDTYNLKSPLQGHYGLLPFAKRPSSNLISNPGCFATATLMALLPLIKNNLIDTTTLVIDAKSGTTGAGKKPKEALMFSEVSGDFTPYRVGEHQHLPEICEAVKTFSDIQIDPHFNTHLLPIDRGLSVAIYTKLVAPFEKIKEAFDRSYHDYPFVRHGEAITELARIKNVIRTAMTHISYKVVQDKLYVFSVIDNLLKGAASQAIENLNQILGLPSHELISCL